MKKRKLNNRVIVLFILITIIGVIAGYRQIKKYNNLLDKISYSSYDSLSDERKDLWNKMKISSVSISKRITGNSLNSSSLYESSNMNGIDISADDEYVKTSDTVSYYLELNIDANTKIDGVTDASEFPGGVIKVRASLPKGQNGEVYATFEVANWMKNYSLTENNTVLYAEYVVPEGTNLVGAIQQLFFTVRIGHNKLENYAGPSFEFWMEGNEPDNETNHVSDINSIKLNDTGLKITSQESRPHLYISEGVVNRYGTDENGVYGTYYNFRLYARAYNSPTSSGYTFKYIKDITSKVKISYFYKALHSDNSKWEEAISGSELYNKVFSGTKLVAYNRNGDLNNAAYPNPTSNYATSYAGFIKNPTTSFGMLMEFDSGNVDASLNDNIITIKNTNINTNYMKYLNFSSGNTCFSLNYYNNDGYYIPGGPTMYSSICNSEAYYFIDAIEVFVPYYPPDGGDYDFQVKFNLIDGSTSVTEEGMEEEISHSTTTLIASSSIQQGEKLSGNITIGGSDYTYIYYGNSKEVRSTFNASDPKHFGEERLINIEGAKLDITSVCTTNLCKTLDVKFGVSKNNPILGLSSTEELNNSFVDDFYWYDSLEDARACTDLVASGDVIGENKCVVTSIHIVDNDYVGGESAPTYTFNVIPNEESLTRFNDGEIVLGAVRQKILLYQDEAHTLEKASKYYYDDEYVPAEGDSDFHFSTSGTPSYAGATAMFVGDYASLTRTITNSRGEKTNYFNVADEKAHMSWTPTINDYLKDNTIERDSFQMIIYYNDTYLTFDENSANILPEVVFDNGTYTYMVWNLKNCEIGGVIPGSCDGIDDSFKSIDFDFDISPFAPNNVSATVNYAYSSGYSYKPYSSTINNKKYYYASGFYGSSIYITNLSGSYARNKTSLQNASPEESFIITNSVYNNSQGVLNNIKTIQLLPETGDSLGNKFNGSYTIRIDNMEENQKLYYTLEDENSSGIIRDKNGKLSIENVDLATSDKWIEVNVNDIIPSGARALASTKDLIKNSSISSYSYEFIPKGNKSGDVYAFKNYASSDNLSTSIATNTSLVDIYSRKISGYIFEDIDKNSLYNDGDNLFSSGKVDLYNDEDILIDSYVTSSDGKYSFDNLSRDNYYIKFNLNNNYEYVLKNVGDISISSSMNNDSKSDVIYGLNVPNTGKDILVENINIGIKKKIATLTVNHYTQKDSLIVLADSEVKNVNWGDYYTTSVSNKISSNYELVANPTNATGVISGDVIVDYYYKIKEAILVVNYVEADTNKVMSNQIKEVVYYGDTYTTTEAVNIPNNYELLRKTTNYTGIVNTDNIEVTYYYQKKDSTIDASINKVGPSEINSLTDKLNYNIEYNVLLEDYIGDGTITIVDKLPYRIDVANSFIDGGVYDDNNKTITWVVNWNDIDTYNNEKNYKVTKSISVIYKDINPADKIIVNSVMANIDLDTKERVIENQSSTNINIKFKVKTEAINEGGQIKGDELVAYGENSTPDFIEIKPQPGYIVSNIFIDNEEVDSDFCRNGCVLGQFIYMVNDKNVKVSFASKVENPDTSIIVSIKFIVVLIIMGSVIFFTSRKFKIRLKKV